MILVMSCLALATFRLFAYDRQTPIHGGDGDGSGESGEFERAMSVQAK